jgi:hypothetical protein
MPQKNALLMSSLLKSTLHPGWATIEHVSSDITIFYFLVMVFQKRLMEFSETHHFLSHLSHLCNWGFIILENKKIMHESKQVLSVFSKESHGVV